jgi:hypothetical protein
MSSVTGVDGSVRFFSITSDFTFAVATFSWSSIALPRSDQFVRDVIERTT